MAKPKSLTHCIIDAVDGCSWPPLRKAVARVMAYHANHQTGVGWYSQETIARWVGCAERTVRREQEELSKADSSPVRLERRPRFRTDGRGRTSDEWRLVLVDQPDARSGYSGASNRTEDPVTQEEAPRLTGSSVTTNRIVSPDQPDRGSGDPCSDPQSDPWSDPASRSSAATEPFNLTSPEGTRTRAPKNKRKAKAKPKKPRASKAPADPTAHKQVTAQYFESFVAKNGRDPIFGGAEGAAVTRLLAKLKGDADEACRRIDIAFTAHWRDNVTIQDIASKPDAFAVPSPRKTNGRRSGPVQHAGVNVLEGAKLR